MSNTAPAREQFLRNAAVRAVDDPLKLDRATRIVSAALQRGRVSPEDYVRRLVDSAPPLTESQRAKLAALLLPVEREARAA